MLKKLHNSYFAFQTVRDRLVSRGSRHGATLGALDEVRQALRSRALRSGAGNDLDGAILMPGLVANDPDSGAATFPYRFAELPVANVCLPSST